jgi:hypothetical protein
MSADRGARDRTDCGSNDCTCHPGIHLRFRRGLPADLLVGILSAIALVEAELVEVPARAGQHHDARASRQRNATGQNQRSNRNKKFKATRHGISLGYDGGGRGATRCHGPAHSFTYG